jgi:hypothetical protein
VKLEEGLVPVALPGTRETLQGRVKTLTLLHNMVGPFTARARGIIWLSIIIMAIGAVTGGGLVNVGGAFLGVLLLSKIVHDTSWSGIVKSQAALAVVNAEMARQQSVAQARDRIDKIFQTRRARAGGSGEY